MSNQSKFSKVKKEKINAMHSLQIGITATILCLLLLVSIIPLSFAQEEAFSGFDDNFVGSVLDENWQVTEGLGSYSLTDNPGYLRYYLEGPRATGMVWQTGESGTWNPALLLSRTVQGDTWILEAKATYNLHASYIDGVSYGSTGAQKAWLFVGFGQEAAPNFNVNRNVDWWYSQIGQFDAGIQEQYGEPSTAFDLQFAPDDTVPLEADGHWVRTTYWYQLEREAQSLTLRYSYDGVNYLEGFDITLTEPLTQTQRVIISATVWATAGSYVDWDYIKVTGASGVDTVPPTINLITPTESGSYPMDSGLSYEFSATDNIDPDVDVTATVVDILGNELVIQSGDPLPTVSDVYTLSITATDDAGLTSNLEVTFTITPVSTESVLFEENFEARVVNSFPSDIFYAQWGGWGVIEESGNNFLRSTASAANYHMWTNQVFSGDIIIEYDERIGSVKGLDVILKKVSGDFSIHLWAYDGETGANYRWTNDNINHVYGGETISTTFVPQQGIWYNFKMTFVDGVGTFYVDDVLLFTYDFAANIPVAIDEFVIYFQTWGQTDIDNIKITRGSVVDSVPPTIELVSPTEGGLYPSDSGVTFEFSATDNIDLDVDITATVVDIQ